MLLISILLMFMSTFALGRYDIDPGLRGIAGIFAVIAFIGIGYAVSTTGMG